jgi:hypothetical protein
VRRRLGLVLGLGVLVAAAGASCNRGATVTAPTLSARCSASPSSGAAPLTVAFGLDVAGAQGSFSVAVDYGDGTQGSDPARAHVYAAPGSYSASFNVTTASQSARCSVPVSVGGTPAATPTPTGSNQPPIPVYKTVPAASGATLTGKAPFTIEFNLCPSSDPDGDRLYFKMDLDGDGVFEYHGATGADCRHEATYAAGTYAPRICVTDVDCSTWPACEGLPQLHPFLCRTYAVVANP